MATANYLTGRKKYGAPQAMLWSENFGTLSNGFYYPDGTEIGANNTGVPSNEQNTFLICSDHNRSELSFGAERIQSRQRMINGNMRAYNIADKLSLSTSWQMLPSRSYKNNPDFNSSGVSTQNSTLDQYTADGGAGGLELLNWYENHQGPFWVFLAYDRNEDQTKYNQITQMYFKDFSYSVIKRGGFDWRDLWNINITLEEV
jgi:hypothetical protein